MFGQRRWDVPVTADWATLRPERTVLAVVHNVTSATRLFDVLPLLATDRRIQIVFTCTESSAFTPGTLEFLAEHRVAVLERGRAFRRKFDLAIAASFGGSLERVTAPLLILPHGIGYNKYLARKTGKPENRKTGKPENRKTGKPVFGLSAEWITHRGRPIATSMVLSHDEQFERLRRSCPAAAPTALVAGDPCFDRMLASASLRGAFRAELGVRNGQRLIFVSSTWGPDSLFGTVPELAGKLRSELPADEYVVVAALHPNIWFGHSPWQTRRWQHDCERDGVVVLPPEEGWRAGLVACDAVIGDHGSVTYYGASLGRPAALAVRPDHTVDPASAIGRFLAAAPVLTGDEPLRPQVERLLSQPLEPAVVDVTGLVSSVPGRSAELLRAELYRLLDLPEPPGPAPTTLLPRLAPRLRPMTATAVEAILDGATARLVRYPAGSVGRGVPPRPGSQLAVSTDEPDRVVLEAAEIIVHDRPGPDRSWLGEVLKSLPGAMIATMPTSAGHWLVATRDGQTLRFTSSLGSGEVWASVVLAWWCAGRDVRDFPATVTAELAGTEYRAVVS